MKRIEHELNPATRAFVADSIKRLNELRQQYLLCLGQAKEAEQAGETLRAALAQQLALVEQTAGLPKPIAPYRLNDAGTHLIGESADAPAAAPAAAAIEAGAIDVEAQPVNGAPIHG